MCISFFIWLIRNALYSMVICDKNTKFSGELLVTLRYPNLPKSSNISGAVTKYKKNNKRSNKYLSVRLCVLYLYFTPCPPMYMGFFKAFSCFKRISLTFSPLMWSELTWIDHIITYRPTWTGSESKSQRGFLPRKLQWWLISTYTKNNNKQTSRNQTRYGLYQYVLLLVIQ